MADPATLWAYHTSHRTQILELECQRSVLGPEPAERAIAVPLGLLDLDSCFPEKPLIWDRIRIPCKRPLQNTRALYRRL